MQPSKPKPVSPTARPVVPWNKGAFVGPKPPLKPKQVWSVRLTLQRDGRIRDLALFDLAIDSKLRGCDLVQLRIGQLVINAAARQRATIVQQKTGKPVQFELTQQTRESLIAWLTHRGGRLQDFVFPQSDGCRRSHQHAAICAPGGRLGRKHWAWPIRLRNAQHAPHQGGPDLQAHR